MNKNVVTTHPSAALIFVTGPHKTSQCFILYSKSINKTEPVTTKLLILLKYTIGLYTHGLMSRTVIKAASMTTLRYKIK